jgi:hypothetical protein
MQVLLPAAIALAFVIGAEYLIGWRELLAPWVSIENPLVLAGPIVLLAASYLLRALRLYRYFDLQRGFGACVRLMVHHNLCVNILPMRTGEVAFPMLMRRYFAVTLKRSLPALAWLRSLDLHALLTLLTLAVATLTQSRPLMIIGVLWVLAPFSAPYIARGIVRFVGARQSRTASMARSVAGAVPDTTAALAQDWLLTALNWLVKLVAFAWIIQLFAEAHYGEAVVGAIGGELSAILPIHGVAGLGTYEGGIVAAMRLLETPTELALTGAVNLHLIVLGTSLLAAGCARLIPLHEIDESAELAHVGRDGMTRGAVAAAHSRRLG